MKPCRDCGEVKPLADFHKHVAMADGHLHSCKECRRKYARSHYLTNRDKYVEYDANRPNKKERLSVGQSLHRARHPDKYRARTALGNAVRDGRIEKKPCCICGETKVEGHHEDYSKPLEVTWFCRRHHRKHEGRSVL